MHRRIRAAAFFGGAIFLALAASTDASRRRRSCNSRTSGRDDNCQSISPPPPCAPAPPPEYPEVCQACQELWEERTRDFDYASRLRGGLTATSIALDPIPADRCVDVPAEVTDDDNTTTLLCDFAARRDYTNSGDPEAAAIGPPQNEGCMMPGYGGDEGDYLGET